MFFEITGIVIWAIIALLVLSRIITVAMERARLDMKNRWVVVTGCDSGIGLGVTEQLAAEGANVIACTYTAEGAERAAKAGAKQTIQFDVADEDAAR